MTNKTRDEGLLDYATERQAEYIRAYWEHGSYSKAAAVFGVNQRNVELAFSRVKAKAARMGYAPDHDMIRTAPDGFKVKGVSTYYNADGKPTGQWVKTNADHARQEQIMREVVAAMVEDVKPVPAIAPPAHTLDRLMNAYIITDYHLGALAWGEETGADWDMAIAERLLVDWFGAAIAQSPNARVGVFAQLGDFLHFDGLSAVTPTSHHVLDADTRFQKLIRTAIRVIRHVIGMLLHKHERVVVLMAEGNHDLASSAWLRELFAALYAEEPRVEVITRPDPYYVVEHGRTSVFFHHGHKKKMESLETVFVAKFREVFGRTKYSYAHTGHLHHNVVKETNTMEIEQHRTLAAPDSHASRGGWISGRDAKVVTYHADLGKVGTIIVSADMLKDAA
jgi:hypothetical protein